jgi:hypothetical protein
MKELIEFLELQIKDDAWAATGVMVSQQQAQIIVDILKATTPLQIAITALETIRDTPVGSMVNDSESLRFQFIQLQRVAVGALKEISAIEEERRMSTTKNIWT